MSFGNLILEVLVNMAGVAYINGYNVACTLSNLFLLALMSLCAAFETFAAQNFGAKEKARVRTGFKRVLQLGIGIFAVIAFLTVFLSKPLIGLYLTDPDSVSFIFAKQFLLLLIPNYLLLLLKYAIDSIYKAQLRIYMFTISSFIALACRIALGYLLAPHYGLIMLAWATLGGNLVAAIFNWINLCKSKPFSEKIESQKV